MARSFQDIWNKYEKGKKSGNRFAIISEGRGRDIFNLYFLKQTQTQLDVSAVLYPKIVRVKGKQSRSKIQKNTIPEVSYYTQLFENLRWVKKLKHDQTLNFEKQGKTKKFLSKRGYYVTNKIFLDVLREKYELRLSEKQQLFILGFFDSPKIKGYMIDRYKNVYDGIFHILREYNLFRLIYYRLKKKTKRGLLYDLKKPDLYVEFMHKIVSEKNIWEKDIFEDESKVKLDIFWNSQITDKDYTDFWKTINQTSYGAHVNYTAFDRFLKEIKQ